MLLLEETQTVVLRSSIATAVVTNKAFNRTILLNPSPGRTRMDVVFPVTTGTVTALAAILSTTDRDNAQEAVPIDGPFGNILIYKVSET